jgi:hypothetical protein
VRPHLACCLLVFLCSLVSSTTAREFRAFEPIATPAALPADAVPLTRPRPIPRTEVERAVHAVADAWNSGTLDPLLGDDFASKSRLLDTIADVVPRDANLKVLAVRAVSVLTQYRRADRIVSTVSAIVHSEITFNDPVSGYRRLEGGGEWYFRVEEIEEHTLSRKDRLADTAPVETGHTGDLAEGRPPLPAYVDDGRMHSIAEEFERLEPRPSTSSEASGTRPVPGAAAGTLIGTATILDAIPPAVLRAAERPASDGARIDTVRPTPVLPAGDLVISGRRFGSGGRLYLEVAGLRLQLAPTRWRVDEVVAPVPAGLEALLGGSPQRGRVWLYSDTGIASAGDVMVGHATVHMDSAAFFIRPAQQIRIEGANFLADRQGSVSLDCPALGRRFEGRILRWTDSTIDVVPTGSFSGRIDSADCELVVTNHRGQAATRAARLEVRNVTLNRHLETRWNFATDGAVLESDGMLGGRMLRNGWVVVDVRFSVDPGGGHRYEWVRRPTSGSTDTLVRVSGVLFSRNRWDQPRDVRFDWTLEGPEGAPLFD